MDFSIIIPHKNSSHLLIRLIKSIGLDNNKQIIVVDDNSCEEEFNNVRKLSEEFGFELYRNDQGGMGAGAARNVGLKYAIGKWLLFADADDYFTSSFEYLTKKFKKSDVDIVFFNTDSVDNVTGESADRHIPFSSIVLNYIDNPCKKTEDDLRYQFLPPWAKMIKRELVESNNIRFDEILGGNDMYFSMNCGYCAKKIAACKDVIYMVTVVKGSISYTLSWGQFSAKLYGAQHCNEFLRQIDKKQYQRSVLYFVARAHQFGFKGVLYVWREIFRFRSNLFIGLGNIFSYKQRMEEREGRNVIKEK